MASFYISAAHKSSGKTTLSIGLSAAIRERGLLLQTFKKGPDYIDPIWLAQASGCPCYNLDFYTSSHGFILDQFHRYSKDKDAILVEGNMGLYDGMALDGSDSNAAMARLLQLPVVLVVDCSGTSRGIAPLLNGYQQFDPEIQFAGVILNKLAGQRHESKIRNVIEAYTDFNILGAVHRNPAIQLTERHLGLIPSNEMAEESAHIINLLAEQVSQSIDIDRLLDIHATADLPPLEVKPAETDAGMQSRLRIAFARDAAFGFYYPGDLERFQELGVELVPFNSLKDPGLPENIDGLFIGGGFPETQVTELTANTSLLKAIQAAISQGLPTYAECGGLMYLCRELVDNDRHYPLCNVIPAVVKMHTKPQGRGYVQLQVSPDHPWYRYRSPAFKNLQAHEFHYSSLQGLPDQLDYAYTINRGTGIDGINDGIISHNLVASYTHLRQTDRCSWVDDFVSFVNQCKESTSL